MTERLATSRTAIQADRMLSFRDQAVCLPLRDRPADSAPLSEKARFLSKTPLFSNLEPEEIEALAGHAQERPMRAGEVLFRRTESGSSMIAILAGEVRIALPGADGRDQVLRVLRAGDVFGEVALLDGGTRTADAVALTNGRLLIVERRDLLQMLQDDQALALRIIILLCNRLRATNWLLEAMLFHDAAARLATTLLMLAADRPGMRLDVTQRTLGEMVGSARETVNKKLREWQAAGILTLEPGRITVRDREALERLAPGADTFGTLGPGPVL
jgi:CRP/FNR family transcriptional regulator, cyclic AMP receptor protein